MKLHILSSIWDPTLYVLLTKSTVMSNNLFEHTHLLAGVAWGWGYHLLLQYGVCRGGAWQVSCTPVDVQVLGQVFTRILQLILIQNDIKHFLKQNKTTGMKPKNEQEKKKVYMHSTDVTGLTGGHWASLSPAIICTFRCLLWDFPLDLMSLWRTYEWTCWVTEKKWVSLSYERTKWCMNDNCIY